tara:strand:- start:6433 stop:7716 length:1284 start_codon:yes stop_codon:yes gene_type:complete
VNIFIGVVEDRNDPLKLGRVRVRIFGLDTHNKQKLGSPDLPWCHVGMPVNTAGIGTLGNVHSLVEGTQVFGIFLDRYKQDFYVLGVHQVIRQDFIGIEHPRRDADKIQSSAELDIGFSDPRRLKKSDYKGTLDGTNPPNLPQRTHSLSASIETSPSRPEFLTIGYDGLENKVTEKTFTEQDLPMYPLQKGGSDLNLFATGDAEYTIRDLSVVPLLKDIERKLKTLTLNENGEEEYKEETHTGVKSLAKPVYPYNKATHTESGHVIEVDDTKHNERLAIEHRTGTFYEIDHLGNEIHRIVNDNYEVICKDDYVFIGGNANLTVGQGNVVINVETGNVDLKVLKGNTDVTSEGKITITGNNTTEIISDTTITGTLHVTGAQTNDSSIVATGEIQTKKGNAPKLSTHTHKQTGGTKDDGDGPDKDTKKPS